MAKGQANGPGEVTRRGEVERKIFNPKEPQPDVRRWKWVELDNGWVVVKEMAASDTLFCLDHSARPMAGPAQFKLDMGGLQIWQVIMSCYRGPEADAPRVFEITDVPVVQKLRGEVWNRLRDAIDEVNGLSDSVVEEAQAFTEAAPAGLPAT